MSTSRGTNVDPNAGTSTGLGHRSLRPGLGLIAAAGATTAAILLSSCGLSSTGIPPTGVVEAGEGAEGIQPAQTIYFVREGSLIGVRYQLLDPPDTRTAVETLFRGPDTGVDQRGLTTELPSLQAPPTVRTNGTSVSVELPPGTEPLNRTALAQLTCTITDAHLVASPTTGTASTPKVKVTVKVTAPDAWQAEGPSEPCPESRAAEPPRPVLTTRSG
ncbi:hypothetical protein AB0D14_09550 [Streptomyces sp. NPDC048484]|uniref:hypothetical protein n=1 Tax=Streptomyces sp. NPDC048484 TaxID=3155146 RepID=UPI0034487BA1